MKKRQMFSMLLKRMQEPRAFIQALIGPRQVGKTTLALQAIKELGKPHHFASADLAVAQDSSWIQQQWELARKKIVTGNGCVLILDEVQKIPKWSDMVKFLWDADTRNGIDLSLVILGSSPWLMQKGLTESLAGRFEVIPITHWSLQEMQASFGWSLEKYMFFGGYPGGAAFADENDQTRWMSYVNDSLIETTVSRDILLMTQINKPALLRRLFQLGCVYSGQILSYTKILCQLQDSGNTATLAGYLDLLSGIWLLAGLQKYAVQDVRKRGSSPKFAVYNTALMSAQFHKTFAQAKQDHEFWGRLTESTVGAHLLNGIRGTQIELFYWRESDKEVDFVLKYGEQLVAIEVKSQLYSSFKRSGMDRFVGLFAPKHVLLIGADGMPLEDFLKISPKSLFD